MRKRKIELNKWLFLLGLILASFHTLPAFFKRFVSISLTVGDVIDFATPWAVISVVCFTYYRICRTGSEKPYPFKFQKAASLIFLGAGFILYVNGHGLHLSANSLGRLFDKTQHTEFYNAAYLLDEVISHYMWDAGVFMISMGLIASSFHRSHKFLSSQNIILVFIGAFLFGFSFAVNGIEGQTIAFVLPAALCGALISIGLRWKESRHDGKDPVTLFFLVAYLTSLVLFAYWGIMYSGFPQFSELGWI
jgi:hypothetical protein